MATLTFLLRPLKPNDSYFSKFKYLGMTGRPTSPSVPSWPSLPFPCLINNMGWTKWPHRHTLVSSRPIERKSNHHCTHYLVHPKHNWWTPPFFYMVSVLDKSKSAQNLKLKVPTSSDTHTHTRARARTHAHTRLSQEAGNGVSTPRC